MRDDDPNPNGNREDGDRPDPALGDGQGFYIGYPKQQPNGVVAYDPALPIQRWMGGAIAFVGDLGRGKTFTIDDIGGPAGGATTRKGG